MSQNLIDSTSDILLNLNINSTRPKYYRLKVNINGFRLEDIKVSLDDCNKENDKVKVKITALRNLKVNNQDTTREYVKYFEILKSKSNINTSSLRYYLDQKNPLFLIIEFLSNSDENVYVNLDDSCESLVEMAAKSLLNIKNIEDLRSTIQDPINSPLNPEFSEIFSPNLIRDLNLATKTTFTPIKIVQHKDGIKKVRVDISLPLSINSVGLHNEPNSPESNHVKIKFDGLKLNLEAITLSENTTSSFSKQFTLPKGAIVDTNRVKYYIDQNKHSLIIETDYLDLENK